MKCKLISFYNYMNIYSTGNSQGFSCILCYFIACGCTLNLVSVLLSLEMSVNTEIGGEFNFML
jgi:hypothetical protein